MAVALNGMLDLTGVKSGRRAGRTSSKRGHFWVRKPALPLTLARGPDGEVASPRIRAGQLLPVQAGRNLGEHRERSNRDDEERPVGPVIDGRPAPGQGVRHENAPEERKASDEHGPPRPALAPAQRPERYREACRRSREVLERLPHHVKVLVRRRVGLTKVKLRGEGCAECAEAMYGGKRTNGEHSEAGLSHGCARHGRAIAREYNIGFS